jgi:hypothetical protein
MWVEAADLLTVLYRLVGMHLDSEVLAVETRSRVRQRHAVSCPEPRVAARARRKRAFSAKDYLSDFPPWSNPENRLVTVLFCCNPLRLVWKTDPATNWQFKIQNARAILRSSREIVQ